MLRDLSRSHPAPPSTTFFTIIHDKRAPTTVSSSSISGMTTSVSGARTITTTQTYVSLPETTVTSQPATAVPSATATPSAASAEGQIAHEGLSTAALAAIAVCVTLAIVLAAVGGWFLYRRHQRAKAKQAQDFSEDEKAADLLLGPPNQPYNDAIPPMVLYQRCPFCRTEQTANVVYEAPVPPVELAGDQPDPCFKSGLVLRRNGARNLAMSRRMSCKF